MESTALRDKLLAAATPLFAAKGFSGTNVREIAGAAGVNVSLISYHFGGKEGLYSAVLSEQFAGFARIAALAVTNSPVTEIFASYLLECGVCFHCGSAAEFTPRSASADQTAPECPCCLTNDSSAIARLELRTEEAA